MSKEILNITFQNRILNFIKKNLKNLIILIILLVLMLFSFLFYKDLQQKNEINISENYTKASIQFDQKKENEAKRLLENIINEGHRFYSPQIGRASCRERV